MDTCMEPQGVPELVIQGQFSESCRTEVRLALFMSLAFARAAVIHRLEQSSPLMAFFTGPRFPVVRVGLAQFSRLSLMAPRSKFSMDSLAMTARVRSAA